mmetsp:Transcript_118674/g.343232  ORF Transcript_118674/g.343232 Transcript_118674/m.343232 type:complete len:332 (+) Transcript_118674:83-1078(+)|eukprot:CAMPEP_0176026666 /NCGR_PEP_ID=MMETSP0120_2-20121206/13065_1 /TAXON_ID=160619 /ORGANISM="Kryptoperidinium foliaceum, Strain CCMP 1326" /LENGTH=331 /DNA_ID=CAMNT_0017359863 /DNA_START=33 /DNA_END=1028 /DNA_ORIENTATION=+
MTTETEEKKKSDDAAKKAAEIAEKLQGLAKPVLDGIVFMIPIIIKYGRMARIYIQKLPTNAFNFIVGFIFCFAGGLYPLLFAAVQAAEHGGRKAVMDSLRVIADEAMKIIEESKKDDKIDADKDGKFDVDELETKEYVQRKFLLVLKKMDPKKVDDAFTNIYRVWLAVAAVLTIEFARAISLALSIADFLKRPVDRYLAPTIQKAVPDEYDRWVPIILGWIAKSIGMSIAYYVHSVRSAFASALTGGLIMARASYQALVDRKIDLGGLLKPDHNDSMADEALSYIFAALGFVFQLSIGFKLPFPLNLILWPFSMGEWAVRWLITSSATIPK